MDLEDQVITFVCESINEESPFEFNSFSFSSDVNFKFDLEFSDVDIKGMSDLCSLGGDGNFVIVIDDFDFGLQSDVNFSSINFNLVGQSDFELMDDGFEVEVKFKSSLFNLKVNVDFKVMDELNLVIEPVGCLHLDFNVNVNFNIVDDGEGVVQPVLSLIFDFLVNGNFDIVNSGSEIDVEFSSSGFNGDMDVSFDLTDLSNKPEVPVVSFSIKSESDVSFVFSDCEYEPSIKFSSSCYNHKVVLGFEILNNNESCLFDFSGEDENGFFHVDGEADFKFMEEYLLLSFVFSNPVDVVSIEFIS